jgi:hypothetical protein
LKAALQQFCNSKGRKDVGDVLAVLFRETNAIHSQVLGSSSDDLLSYSGGYHLV